MRTLKNLGSIVLIKNSQKRLMITGRFVRTRAEGKDFDYVGCLYPEGHIGGNAYLLFNDEDIAEVVFPGLENDPEDISFLKKLEEAVDARDDSRLLE